MTMTLVSTVTVGAGGAASIEWTGIPQTGTDLLVLISGRGAGATGSLYLKFNASTTGYTGRQLFGNGSSVASYTDGSLPNIGNISGSGTTANTFGDTLVYVPNYAGSTNKSFSADSVSENNATTAYQQLYAGVLANTAAITSLTLTNSSNFAQYTVASLYTITKGSGGASVA